MQPMPEVGQVLLELGAEGGVLNVVNLPLEPVLAVMDGHATPAGAKVRVVVHSEENIQGHVLVCYCAKKAAHYVLLYIE